jgi:hypothetical protein
VRQSGRSIKEDWPQYWDYARRRGSIYGTVLPPGGAATKRSTASTGELASEQDRRNLASLGDEKRGGRRSVSPLAEKLKMGSTSVEADRDRNRSTTPFSLGGRTPTLFKRASRAPTIIPRTAPITRMSLIESAERIWLRYLTPAGVTVQSGQNHEIYLPPALRIHTFPLSSSHEPKTDQELTLLAQIPDLFHAQKEYCFRAMEQDAFPRFLRAKAFGNLTPVSALVRLILGLIILWIGLAAGFCLIFLDVLPKSKRIFVGFPSLSFTSSHINHARCDSWLSPSFSRSSSSSPTNMSWTPSSSSSTNQRLPPSGH